MTVEIGFANILVYMLVWVRLAGMILFNPMLSRRNVPSVVRNGLVLLLCLLLAPMQSAETMARVYEMSGFGYALAIVFELVIGIVYGFVFQLFYYMLFFVGDLLDTDIGLSMARSFDPGTNIQAAFSSSLITLMFSLYIFATNSHLALIRVFAQSFDAISVGSFTLNAGVVEFILQLFTAVFLLALRLWAPFLVAEFVLQVSMGILMKFIPQISVFVINFQLRILLGVLLLFLFAPFIGQFIDNYITVLFDNLWLATDTMAAAAA